MVWKIWRDDGDGLSIGTAKDSDVVDGLPSEPRKDDDDDVDGSERDAAANGFPIGLGRVPVSVLRGMLLSSYGFPTGLQRGADIGGFRRELVPTIFPFSGLEGMLLPTAFSLGLECPG